MTTTLVTGATGFVGAALLGAMTAAGLSVRAATREPERARASRPGVPWVRLDLGDRATVERALAGCTSAVYLVHAMSQGPGYEARDRDAAQVFTEGAAAAGLERIVYLGGVAPPEHASRHLKSRVATGEILRAGRVPVFELRAAMVIGHGSVSWQIVRDLAHRLPVMILPRWLTHRSCPIGIDDVVFALQCALHSPVERAGVYELSGPEALSGKDILVRVARLRGTRPTLISVPVLSPRLSSYWLKLVTGADYRVARELVDGLSTDLLPSGRPFWDLAPEHACLAFDEAARRALAREGPHAVPTELFERAVAAVSRSTES